MNPMMIAPIIAFLFIVGIAAVILLVYFSLRTKRATEEADLGEFQFVLLPEGESITGIVTLARSLVSDQYLQTLVDAGKLKDESAKKLSVAFEKLFFYAIKNGRVRYLFVSRFNIESPQYHVPIRQIFSFPFGFRSHRMVVADSKSTQRAGWEIRNITPYERGKKLDTEAWKEVCDVGDCAASLKEAAIRLQNEQPWKEVALAVRHELDEALGRLENVTTERDKALLALSTKPLLQSETPVQEVRTGGGIPFWRIVISIIMGAAAQWLILPALWPTIDPTVYSIIICGVTFFAYPWVHSKLSEVL
jgi:hypothetical protein